MSMGERFSHGNDSVKPKFPEGVTPSRRDIIKTVALIPTVGGVLGTPVYLRQEERRQREIYDNDFLGFEPLSQLEFSNLVKTHTESPLAFQRSEENAEGVLSQFTFTLDKPSQIYCYLVGEHADTVFVDPLIVQSENKRPYIAPVIHTDNYDKRPIKTVLQLGSYDKGEHTLTITEDRVANFPRQNPLEVYLQTPDDTSLLARFMEYNPVITLKNQDNVLDDIPLMSFCNIAKRDDIYKVTSYIIFSSENGGMFPNRLLENFQRTVDVEWVMEQLFTHEGKVLNNRRRLQTQDHNSKQFEGRYMVGNRPVLENATPNNLFSDHRFTLPFIDSSFDNPFAESEDEAIYYSPKPLFLPGTEGSSTILKKHPELQRWSFIELAEEGCVDRNDQRLQPFLDDLEDVEQHLNAVYPNRGCKELLSGDILGE